MSKPTKDAIDPAGFSDVDAAGNTSEYFAYLDRAKAASAELLRARYQLLELKTGDHVLDVGCGLGHDAREFASMVGPGGRVVGIDFSEAMIAKARKRFEQANLPVQFAVGDAQRLNFADNSFDGCWSIRVLQHLVEPAYAIAEMARVARPGGRIAVFEPDHEMTAIDATDRVTTRIIRSSWVDRIRSGWAGRQLFALFHAAGLTDVQITATPAIRNDFEEADALLGLVAAAHAAVTEGLVTQEAATNWVSDLRERQVAGRFFACIVGFNALGRKP